MELVLPSAQYRKSFLEALEELRKEAAKQKIEIELIRLYDGAPDFNEFVEILRGRAEGKYLPEGYVPTTVYWLVDGDTFLGWLNIRHRLNKNLLRIGGHIGYTIRPSERRRGYGGEILRRGLEKAKALEIKRALLTCNDDNVASRKIIEKNGGIFENTVTTNAGIVHRHYWITLS